MSEKSDTEQQRRQRLLQMQQQAQQQQQQAQQEQQQAQQYKLVQGAKEAFEVITLLDEEAPEQRLTLRYLVNCVNPYLSAIGNLQDVVNQIRERKPREIYINEIRQESPITVSFSGAAETVQLIMELVIPWTREHRKNITRLKEELIRAEILKRHVHAQKDREESKKIAAETEKLQLENDRLRLELDRDRLQLSFEVINRFAPDLSKNEKLLYVMKLTPSLKLLTESSLQVSDVLKK